MTDKVQKIREEVEKLKSNLIYGACSSQIAMETMCKEEAYNEVLAILDTMQEEPQVKESAEIQHVNDMCKEKDNSLTQETVSNVWHDMSEEAENGRNIIIIDPKDFYGAVLRKGGSQLKNHNKERYVKWAYIDELIEL